MQSTRRPTMPIKTITIILMVGLLSEFGSGTLLLHRLIHHLRGDGGQPATLINGGQVEYNIHRKIALPSINVVRKPIMVPSLQITRPQITRETEIVRMPQETRVFAESTDVVGVPQTQVIGGTSVSGGVVETNIIPGRTQVFNDEKEEVVEQVKRTVVEEKVPTIIKTRIPTYVQQTMEQKVIREHVPRTIQEEETHMVTETKPVMVTRTRPVTIRKNKTVYETRDRVVNVPGRQIVTQGEPVVTKQVGQSSYRVLGEEEGESTIADAYGDETVDDAIGFRFLSPTNKKKTLDTMSDSVKYMEALDQELAKEKSRKRVSKRKYDKR